MKILARGGAPNKLLKIDADLVAILSHNMNPLVLSSSSSSEGSIEEYIKKVFAPPAWYTRLHPPTSSSSDSSIAPAVFPRKKDSNVKITKKPSIPSSSLVFSSSSEDESLETFIKKVFAPPLDFLEFPASSSSSSSVASVVSYQFDKSSSSESVGDDGNITNVFYDDCIGSSKVEYESSDKWYITRLNKRKKRRTER
jgi:hypothetical protein